MSLEQGVSVKSALVVSAVGYYESDSKYVIAIAEGNTVHVSSKGKTIYKWSVKSTPLQGNISFQVLSNFSYVTRC